VAQIRVLGGAMARVPADATAFAHRSSRIMVNVAALYERPDEAAVYEPWITDFAAALRQGDYGAYVGFLGDEGEGRIREAYPGPTWQRLAEIKGRYDPTNLFRLNQNIRPSAQPTSDAVSANTATGSRFALTKNRFTPSVDTSEQVADS
jgi:Berberine and berberine like